MLSFQRTYTLTVYFFALTIFLGPCDEPLPPYSEPEVFLDGAVRVEYVCTWAFGNRMIAYLDVTNIYEETLDDQAQFEGTIEFRSARRPDMKRTFTLGPTELISGPGYNRQTGQLTLDPEATLVFRVTWDLSIDDRGVDPRAELFTFYEDESCPTIRSIAVQEEFIVSGEVQVFGQRARVEDSMVFPLCYFSAAIAPPFLNCIEARTDPPCIMAADTAQARTYPFGFPNEG